MRGLFFYLFSRPKYTIGQIVDFGEGQGLGTITERKYKNQYERYHYYVDGMGWLEEYSITDYLTKNGDLGAL